MLSLSRPLFVAVVIGMCMASLVAAEPLESPAGLDRSIAGAVEEIFGPAAEVEDGNSTQAERSRAAAELRESLIAQERAAMTAALAAAAAQQRAAEARETLFAERIETMERLLLAQHDREVALYRDTIRLVTIFGGAFAALCMIGLFGAAFLNYRALVAVQAMSARTQEIMTAPERGPALLESAASVPGLDRVKASGRRFQSRMSSLEQRLAELEHLAGRAAPTSATEIAPDEVVPAGASVGDEPVFVAPAPTQVIPRAMILVHKAQALTHLGKLNDALATLDEAAVIDATKTEVHLARGQVLEKMGRLGDALNAYDTAVGADDHNTSALLLKAGVLNRQERFNEALACYERALEVHRAAV